ncbi:MAG: 30S ribosomal protein S6 [bacterium]
MKNTYELYFIIKSHLDKSVYQEIEKNVQKWIVDGKGSILHFEVEGLRPLATMIKKQKEGYYMLCQFDIPVDSLPELEHKLRIDESILRYMIVTIDTVRPRFKKSDSVESAA